MLRSNKRIGDGAKVLSLLRNTDTFPDSGFLAGNAVCGKVSVPPAGTVKCNPLSTGFLFLNLQTATIRSRIG